MKRLNGRIRDYDWGSPEVIPNFFGQPAASKPIAEAWFGAHPAAPSYILPECEFEQRDDADGASAARLSICAPQFVQDDDFAAQLEATGEGSLAQFVATDPKGILGPYVAAQFGRRLPFLLKLVAPSEPLSLQVHPSIDQALDGFRRESEAGIDVFDVNRSYRDQNHKPELLYALSRFEALAGFRSPRRILGVLEDLDATVARRVFQMVEQRPNQIGVRAAFNYLLSPDTRPDAAKVAEVVSACAARDPESSPSPRADAIVKLLARTYPDDPGVVASLLLNPVTLNPGEALFIPARTVHAYLSGFGVEVMSNSDNVLRAGLTSKHVDVLELMQVVDTAAAPPIRVAPEKMSQVQNTFYAPVDDFELSIVQVSPGDETQPIRGSGPRILLMLEGEMRITAHGLTATAAHGHMAASAPGSNATHSHGLAAAVEQGGCASAPTEFSLSKGQAVFLETADGLIDVSGFGILAQVAVP